MQQHRRRRIPWRFVSMLAALLAAFLAPEQARASHFRYGTLTWQQAGVSTTPAGQIIQYNINTSWRRGFSGWTGTPPSPNPTGWVNGPNPPVGAKINIGTMFFGDGTTAAILATVNSSDATSDIINTSAQLTHVYSNAAIASAGGLFVVNALNSGDRLSTIFDGNKDDPYNLQARVNVSVTAPFNNSPASSLPAVVNVPDGQTSSFTIPGVDPDGDVVTFRLSRINSPSTASNTPATKDENRESGLTIQSPVGFSLAPNGTVTMTTTAAAYAPTQVYAVQVMMEDHVGNAASAVKSKVPVDFLIRIVPFSNPPVFISPTPANNSLFTVVAGGTVSFGIAARDNDTLDAVTLNPVQVPPGSTMTPALPVTGPVNGTVSSTFNWTTTSTDVGTKIVTFAATDNLGVQTLTSVTIQVLCALDATAVITNNSCFGQSTGAINLTPSNFSSAANLQYTWSGPNSFSASTEDVTGLAAGSYSVRIDDILTNCFIIKNFVVEEPTKVTASASATDVSCPGRSDGTVTVTAGGGTGSLSYDWTPNVSSTSGASSLAPGSYAITVTDMNGCSAGTSATVGTTPDNTAPVPAMVSLLPVTAECSATVTAIPTALDNCNGTINGTTTNPLTYSTQGTHTITWSYDDGNGNISTQQQTVVIDDITAPAVPTLATVIGECSATATAPTTTDNCAGIITGTTTDPLSYSAQGTYTIHWTFNDGNGNTSTANQTVIVDDNTAPVIATFTTPPSPVTISSAGRATTYTNLRLNGNGNVLIVNPGDPVNLTASWNSFYDGGGGCPGCVTQHYLGIGTTPIDCHQAGVQSSNSGSINANFTAPAAGGVYYISQAGVWCYNCGDCVPANFGSGPANAVAVLIVRTPVCHEDVTVNNTPNTCGAAVNYVTPSVVDNCSGATIAQTAGLPNNSVFPVGTTTNTYSAVDAGNNSAVCSFNVIVIDNQLPTITAPLDVSVNTDAGLCSASGVALGTPATADNCSVATITNNAPSSFPKGTTIVTWTVTDNNGNIATATQNVMVTDGENPTVTAPAGISANADAGQCYATIQSLGSPVFSDNCPGSTVSNNAPANNQYPVGTTTVTWTAHDADNHTATATQTITVTDAQNPTITAPAAVTVATDANLCSASGVALGSAATADNCGVASVTNNAPASFPKGTTTVTWTVLDVNGNTATATQTVTVEDRQNPAISAPAAVMTTTSADGTGNCTTTANLGTPATSDNCGAVSVSAKIGATTINPSTYAFPIGTTTVTWTATDGSGNTANATQAVTVTDNEKPTVNCPANVAQCYNASGNPVTLTLSSSDNCSATTTSWIMVGATTGSGTGGTVTRNFTTGTTNVYWQVRDASNNISVCTTSVIIRALPTVSIAASGADEFCNATTLTASISPAGTGTYAWTYNNAPFAATQTIRLKLSNGDGIYRVVATDGFGCSSAPSSYNFQKQTLVNMYVLLGMKEVDLAQNNDVINGSVGVTSSHGEADFDKYCSVASPGAFVKAVDIDTKSPVTIPTKIYSQAVVTLPTMYLNSSNPNSLSNYVMTTNGTVNGNKKDLTINSNKTVTVTGNIFRKIRICHDADVTFTASDISLESMDIDQGATVRFTNNTKLRVSDEVKIDKECSINPSAKIVTFYIKEPSSSNYNCWDNWNSWHSWSNGSSEKFIVDGKGTNVIANVYVPNGKIRVHGNGWNCSWNQSEACNMMGLFIAEEIEGDGKNINWHSYDCSMPASFRQVAHVAPLDEAADYTVLMYPNPTTGQFSLQFSNTAEAAQVRITDIQGRLISTRTVEVSEMPSAGFSLTNQVPGVYMVEIQQGANTVRNRIVLR